MRGLTENEKRVLDLRDSGFSLREIARIMGWKGQERVRQIEARARRKSHSNDKPKGEDGE